MLRFIILIITHVIIEEQEVNYPRCVIIIEGGEDLGSPDLWHYLDQLEKKNL